MRGKVVKIISNFFYVSFLFSKNSLHDKEIACQVKGTLIKDHHIPRVGDEVEVELISEKDNQGLIVQLYPRKNRLIKPAVANVDQVVIVTSAKNPKPNLQLIDRLLVWAYFENLSGTVCINKKELNYDRAREIKDIYRTVGFQSVMTSVRDEDIDELPKLLAHKVSVLAGQSGAGKSSLINHLKPELNLATSPVSRKSGKGRQTTRHSQLFEIGEGYLVDTPGFNRKKLPAIFPEQLGKSFPEIRKLVHKCKFNDCSHREEPGCAVRLEIGSTIPETRYQHYVDFYNELVEFERSFYK